MPQSQNLTTGLFPESPIWQENGASKPASNQQQQRRGVAACDFPSLSPILVLMIIFNYIKLRHRYFNVTGVVVRSLFRRRTLCALLGQVPRLRFEQAAEQGDAAARLGLSRPLLLLRGLHRYHPEFLQVGNVEAVWAEHAEDHGEEG